MRLSPAKSVCWHNKKYRLISALRRNHTSGHRKDGSAVGNPRLVNSAEMRRVTREGVVIRRNRLTELDLTGTHGSTFVQRARSAASLTGRRMRYCQDLLSRDRKRLMHISPGMKNIIPMSVTSWKPDDHKYLKIHKPRIQGFIVNVLFFCVSRVGFINSKAYGLGLIVIRVKMGITYTQKRID